MLILNFENVTFGVIISWSVSWSQKWTRAHLWISFMMTTMTLTSAWQVMRLQQQIWRHSHRNGLDGSADTFIGAPTCPLPVTRLGKHRTCSAKLVAVATRSAAVGRSEAGRTGSSLGRAGRSRRRQIRYEILQFITVIKTLPASRYSQDTSCPRKNNFAIIRRQRSD